MTVNQLVLWVWSIIGVKVRVCVLYCRFVEPLKVMTLCFYDLMGLIFIFVLFGISEKNSIDQNGFFRLTGEVQETCSDEKRWAGVQIQPGMVYLFYY